MFGKGVTYDNTNRALASLSFLTNEFLGKPQLTPLRINIVENCIDNKPMLVENHSNFLNSIHIRT